MLRSGRVADLGALASERERVLGWLSDLPETGSEKYRRDLARLRESARRNSALLKAYIEGARSALATVTLIDEEQANLGAYARDGSRITAPTATSTTRKKA